MHLATKVVIRCSNVFISLMLRIAEWQRECAGMGKRHWTQILGPRVMGIAEIRKHGTCNSSLSQCCGLRGAQKLLVCSDPGKWANFLLSKYLLYAYHLPVAELCTRGYGNEFLELWS